MTLEEQARVVRTALVDGVCQDCLRYAEHFDPAYLRAERTFFLEAVQTSSPVVLALSGGKDSLTALYLLAEVLQVPTVAFLYQNGFIPAAVVEQAERMCDRYRVPLQIVTNQDLLDAFAAEYWLDSDGRLRARTGHDFCQLCSQQVQKVALACCEQQGASWVVFGNKVYTQLLPQVSSLRTWIHNGKRLHSINLLYTLGLSSRHQGPILKQMGWQDPGLAGYTTNCLLPGLVAEARRERLQMQTDQGYIERELRSGAYSSAEAAALLAASELPLSLEMLEQQLPEPLRAHFFA